MPERVHVNFASAKLNASNDIKNTWRATTKKGSTDVFLDNRCKIWFNNDLTKQVAIKSKVHIVHLKGSGGFSNWS